MTRVLIADANAQFRSALRRLIERDGDIVVVGEASTLAETLTAATRLGPDVALVDLGLPGLDDGAQLEPLQALGPDVGLILLSLLEPTSAEDARRDGLDYLLKSGPAEEIVAAVRRRARSAAPIGS